VGVGIEITATSFRYIEVYTSKLGMLTTPTPNLHAAGVRFSAKLTSITDNNATSASERMTPACVPYAVVLCYDPKPTPLSVAQILEKSETDPLPDVPSEVVAVVWPWQLDFSSQSGQEEKQDAKEHYSFELDVQNALDDSGLDLKYGDYYLQLFVSMDPSSVPFESAVSDLDVPLAGKFGLNLFAWRKRGT
jgi:hypothetical protein